MAKALGEEIAGRDAELGRPENPALARLARLREMAAKLIVRASTIAASYLKNENVPLNFRVLAAQLGEAGAPIGIIASNYTLLSQEMRDILDAFISRAEDVRRTIDDGYFLTAVALLQREVVQFFEGETDGDESNRAQEVASLRTQSSAYAALAGAGLKEIDQSARTFRTACAEMRRLAAGLEVTRVMSVVECARQVEIAERATELLADLQRFQTQVANDLKEVELVNAQIADSVKALLEESSDPKITMRVA